MSDNYAAFLAQLEQISPRFRQAFEEAIADITSTTQLRAFEAAIERGDVEAAIRAVALGREFFAPLDRMMQDAFAQGAIWQLAQTIPKTGRQAGSLQIRFDGRHPRAEAWTRQQGALLVTEVSESIKEAIRVIVQDGLSNGRSPRKVALDIAGRMNRATNRREGGVVGLTSQQAAFVANARHQLEELDSGYFERRLRDRRYDRTVAKAIREGKPMAQADIDRIVARYSDRMLKYRGDVIGRTEGLRALNAGRFEGVLQMVDKGSLPADAVTLEWQSTPDRRTRDTHLAMNGQQVKMGQPFTSPLGYQMMHPGDTSLMAPASETIQCRCSMRVRVDWAAMAI